MKSRLALQGVALILTFPLAAQDVSLTAPPRRAELGLLYQEHTRNFQYSNGNEVTSDWNRYALFLRTGIGPMVAVELNGFVWHVGSTDAFPARDYFQYTFGTAITVLPIRVGPARLGVAAHYWELGNMDQSPSHYDKRQSQLSVVAGANFRFKAGRTDIEIWGGPGMTVDRIDDIPPYQPPVHGRSTGDFGALAGGSLLFADRLRLSGRLGYLPAWQPQFALSILL